MRPLAAENGAELRGKVERQMDPDAKIPAVRRFRARNKKPSPLRVITPEVGEEICRRIASGRTLYNVAADKDLPHRDTIYYEMERSPAFRAAVALARAASSHALADQIIDIADKATAKTAHVARNRCDQRRWLAAKFNPMYADMQRHADADGSSLLKQVEAMSPEERRRELAELMARSQALLATPVIEGEAEEVGGGPAK